MTKRTSGQSKAKPSTKKKSTDAIEMLKEDHRTVEKLFKEFLEAEGKHQQQIAQQIFHELEVHSTLEEEIFYPALQPQSDSQERASSQEDEALDEEEQETVNAMEHDETDTELEEEEDQDEDPDEATQDMIETAYEEHRAIRDMIDQLKRQEYSSSEYRRSMIDLQQAVMDHVTVEEDEVFAEAQLSLDTKALGKQLQQRKQEIVSAAA